jgi:hypothetical protein
VFMEIKLKTTRPDESGETILDEHGALWNYSGPKSANGIFPATTKGLSGEDIFGFYQNGALFIVNRTDARDHFNSICKRGC